LKISIASGKGGTGKTTLSVNLAGIYEEPVTLLDCDVEEPNAALFLSAEQISEKPVNVLVPIVDESKCDACGLCARFCQYKAIVAFGTKPLIFPELCHSCGGCKLVCPRGAITEVERTIGKITTFRKDKMTLLQGKLDVGVSTSPPVIRALKKMSESAPLVIIDSPPGTSCPVVTSVRDTDFVVLVTEPTPFGLHDLSLAVDMIQELKLPFGVVVNRNGSGDNRVHEYCKTKKIPLLLEIPDDRRIMEAYSKGIRMIDALPEYRNLFLSLRQKIDASVKEKKGGLS